MSARNSCSYPICFGSVSYKVPQNLPLWKFEGWTLWTLWLFFFCLPQIGSKWYSVLSLWEFPNAPPHDPRERKCYLETTSEYTLKARSQSKKNGGLRTNKLWSALWWMIYPLFHTKMFIGSLVASRFLSLIAHFVVTVIIFLSKVSKGINAESVYKFICPGKLTS